jgi:hypothetical protein
MCGAVHRRLTGSIISAASQDNTDLNVSEEDLVSAEAGNIGDTARAVGKVVFKTGYLVSCCVSMSSIQWRKAMVHLRHRQEDQ